MTVMDKLTAERNRKYQLGAQVERFKQRRKDNPEMCRDCWEVKPLRSISSKQCFKCYMREYRKNKANTMKEERDNRPIAPTFPTDNFLICKIVDHDDFRMGAWVESAGVAKWTTPDGRDVSFTRAELAELHAYLGRVLEAHP